MRTLIIGCEGQLGVALTETRPGTIEMIGVDRPELDIADAQAVEDLCREIEPSVIVVAAAYTAVDQAELEPDIARLVNSEGPRNAAVAARSIGARLIHISTDFVFDGESRTPYAPGASTHPLSVYGETKRDGELAVMSELSESALVVRTAWLYSKTRNNFVKTMLRLMQERDELSVVADQHGTPTWANSLAQAVWTFVSSPPVSGIYHWTDGGHTTWYEFAVAIQEEAIKLGLLNKRVPLHAITTPEFPTPARRPAYGVLDCSATEAVLGLRPSHWRVNLHHMLEGMKA